MDASYQLGADEAADILRAFFEYNEKKPTDVVFIDAEGNPVELSAVIVKCSAEPMRVRVVPEPEEDRNDPVNIVRRFTNMPIPGPMPGTDNGDRQ